MTSAPYFLVLNADIVVTPGVIDALAAHLDRPTLEAAVAAGQPLDVDWGLGASWLVRRAAWAEIGPMDVEYFLYFEDVD